MFGGFEAGAIPKRQVIFCTLTKTATMCRWLAYTGAPVLMSELLLKPKDNLIQQSLHARSPRTPTNGDGFGLGWYDAQPRPGLFKSIRPAWNDFNLIDLVSHIESSLFLA